MGIWWHLQHEIENVMNCGVHRVESTSPSLVIALGYWMVPESGYFKESIPENSRKFKLYNPWACVFIVSEQSRID